MKIQTANPISEATGQLGNVIHNLAIERAKTEDIYGVHYLVSELIRLGRLERNLISRFSKQEEF